MPTKIASRMQRSSIILSVGILIALTVSFFPAYSPARATNPYNCNGMPYYQADLVCHSLSIVNLPNEAFGASATIWTGWITCTNPCDGYLSQEIKLADTHTNWVELGFIAGHIQNCGAAGQTNPCTEVTGYYWTDSRPIDPVGWNFHYIRPLAANGVPGDFNNTDENKHNVDFTIHKESCNRIQPQWDMQIYDWRDGINFPGTSTQYDYFNPKSMDTCTVGGSTNNSFAPTSVQMGAFLTGTHGMHTDTNQYSFRGYESCSGTCGVFDYTNYQTFDDSPLTFNQNNSPRNGDFTVGCVGTSYGCSTGASPIRASTSSNTNGPLSSPDSGAKSNTTLPQGFPAIRAGNSQATSRMSFVANPISAKEVLDFAATTAMPFDTNHTVPKPTRARLLTGKQISQLLNGESTGFSDTKQLWFVEMTGKFNYRGETPKGPVNHGYEIFDPDTGNLIMMGTSA